MKKHLTKFDADRTLFWGPSTEWALKSLAAEASILDTHRATFKRLDTLNSPQGNRLEYIREAGPVLAHVIASVPEATLTRIAHEQAEIWQARIFAEMKPEIATAAERGPIVVISYGPDAFIRPFAEQIGAYGVGRSPADYLEAHKPSKLAMATLACQKAGIDFAWDDPGTEKTVYGDAKDDLPLLYKADVPVLVNPLTSDIRQEGERQGWRIIDCADINQFGSYGYLDGLLVPE